MTDADIRRIVAATRTIALVGFSQNPGRPSHGVARFLQRQGYRVIPVNPGLAGQVHLGEVARGSLAEIADPVDLVDIFRRAENVPQVVTDALVSHPEVKAVWMQQGIVNEAAATAARAAGMEVVMDRCLMTEIARLGIAPVA